MPTKSEVDDIKSKEEEEAEETIVAGSQETVHSGNVGKDKKKKPQPPFDLGMKADFRDAMGKKEGTKVKCIMCNQMVDTQ